MYGPGQPYIFTFVQSIRGHHTFGHIQCAVRFRPARPILLKPDLHLSSHLRHQILYTHTLYTLSIHIHVGTKFSIHIHSIHKRMLGRYVTLAATFILHCLPFTSTHTCCLATTRWHTPCLAYTHWHTHCLPFTHWHRRCLTTTHWHTRCLATTRWHTHCLA